MEKVKMVEDKLVRAIQAGEAEEIIRDYYRSQDLPVPRIN